MGSTPANLLLLTFGNDIVNFIVVYRKQANMLLDLVSSAIKLKIRETQLEQAEKKLAYKQKQFNEITIAKKSGEFKKNMKHIKIFWKIGKKCITITRIKRWKEPGDPFKFDCEGDIIMLDDKLLAKCSIMMTVSKICWQLGDEFEELAEIYFQCELAQNSLDTEPLQSKFAQLMKKIRKQEAIMKNLRAQLDKLEDDDDVSEESVS